MSISPDAIKEKAEKLTPAVHLNGDTKETLENTWKDFHDSIRGFKFPEMNGRNYYVKTSDYGDALTAANAELDKLRETLCEWEKVVIQVRINIDHV